LKSLYKFSVHFDCTSNLSLTHANTDTTVMAARHFLLHRLRLYSFQGFTVAPPQGHRLWCSATSSPEEATENASGGTHTGCSDVEVDYPKGCVKEEKIVSDIAPAIQLAKHIIFSPRYFEIQSIHW